MDEGSTESPSLSRASSVTLGFEEAASRHQSCSPPPQGASPDTPITLDDDPMPLDNNPIILDDDSDSENSVTVDNDPDTRYCVEDIVEVAGSDIKVLDPHSRQQPLQQYRKVSVEAIDLTSEAQDSFNDGDYLTDEALARLAPSLGRDEESSAELSSPRADMRIVPEVCVQGIIYKPGQSLELHDKSYLRVDNILIDSVGDVFFRGRRLRKLRDLVRMDKPKGYLPVWKYELLWEAKDDEQDIPLTLVRRFVVIRFTNCIKSEQTQWASDPERKLFCRLKEVALSNHMSIQYLSRDEADDLPGCQSEPWELRQQWRGATRLFGAADKDAPSTHNMTVIDLEPDHSDSSVVDLTAPEPDDRVILRLNNSRKYTFGDAFCGAGGVSSGGRKAGLKIKWGFDKSSHAMSTYRLNFKSAACEVSDIFDFLTNDPEFMVVDICHGSPPCQTFSPAKTVECETDDANFACIFSCADLMKKAKPRVLTMEETSGLYERHRDVFDRVIQGFLEIGYSVNWRMLNCEEYGVPQCRRRLIIIASGPGETLPSFPKPTHGPPGSGLLPQTTINSIIRVIPQNAADHDVEAALGRGLRVGHREPFDADQQAMTITTGGGQFNYHPSGKRGFTNREFAALQTFDVDYQFGQREVRRQIGNAVPPVLAKAVYREIIKSLKRSDSAEATAKKNRGIDEF